MEIQTGEQLLELMRQFQIPCVLAAAADLDVFERLAQSPRSAEAMAETLGCDVRAMKILLNALAAIGILEKTADSYGLPASLGPLLTNASPDSVDAMLRHQANCLRSWARLPWVVRSGSSTTLKRAA